MVVGAPGNGGNPPAATGHAASADAGATPPNPAVPFPMAIMNAAAAAAATLGSPPAGMPNPPLSAAAPAAPLTTAASREAPPGTPGSGAFRGYGCAGFRLGLAGGMTVTVLSDSLGPSPLPARSTDPDFCASRCSFEKNFCACERICTALLVPMCSSIFFHARPCSLSASRKPSCSASVHRSRCFVIVYGLRTFADAAWTCVDAAEAAKARCAATGSSAKSNAPAPSGPPAPAPTPAFWPFASDAPFPAEPAGLKPGANPSQGLTPPGTAPMTGHGGAPPDISKPSNGHSLASLTRARPPKSPRLSLFYAIKCKIALLRRGGISVENPRGGSGSVVRHSYVFQSGKRVFWSKNEYQMRTPKTDRNRSLR